LASFGRAFAIRCSASYMSASSAMNRSLSVFILVAVVVVISFSPVDGIGRTVWACSLRVESATARSKRVITAIGAKVHPTTATYYDEAETPARGRGTTR